MKKCIIVISLLSLFAPIVLCKSTVNGVTETKTIRLIISRQKKQMGGRSILPNINVYANYDEHVIEFEDNGLSQGTVCITDLDNNIVNYQTTFSLDSFRMDMPNEAGTYVLTIDTEEFTAEGVFYVY